MLRLAFRGCAVPCRRTAAISGRRAKTIHSHPRCRRSVASHGSHYFEDGLPPSFAVRHQHTKGGLHLHVATNESCLGSGLATASREDSTKSRAQSTKRIHAHLPRRNAFAKPRTHPILERKSFSISRHVQNLIANHKVCANGQDHPVRAVERPLPKRHSRTRRASVGSLLFWSGERATIVPTRCREFTERIVTRQIRPRIIRRIS